MLASLHCIALNQHLEVLSNVVLMRALHVVRKTLFPHLIDEDYEALCEWTPELEKRSPSLWLARVINQRAPHCIHLWLRKFALDV